MYLKCIAIIFVIIPYAWIRMNLKILWNSSHHRKIHIIPLRKRTRIIGVFSISTNSLSLIDFKCSVWSCQILLTFSRKGESSISWDWTSNAFIRCTVSIINPVCLTKIFCKISIKGVYSQFSVFSFSESIRKIACRINAHTIISTFINRNIFVSRMLNCTLLSRSFNFSTVAVS